MTMKMTTNRRIQQLERQQRRHKKKGRISVLLSSALFVVVSLAVAARIPSFCQGFTNIQHYHGHAPQLSRTAAAITTTTTSPRHQKTQLFNFLKDAFSKAFENDRNLSSDKTKQQYDAPGEEFDDQSDQNVGTLTETQKLWREKVAAAGIATDDNNTNNGGGVNSAMVVGTSLVLDMYLSGVPEKDPSNDLYGSRVNISNRDKATGLSLPSSPSTSITIQFLPDGICHADESSFTSGTTDGQWKISDDGKFLRFSIDQVGYKRTAVTKGTIQNVAWTSEEERTTSTSTTYSIPPGFVFCDVPVVPAKGRPGIAGSSFNIAGDGILRLEQESGLFGISSRMVACGKFQVAKKIKPEA